jgi:B12-binding domain/radical SAM domain protein
MGYDVVFLHPPALYDFRERNIFPGPIAYTVGDSTEQFMIPPIGILSMAGYLDRNGYKVLVVNLCEQMVNDKYFDAEKRIKELSARVYAVGLHWCVHSQGAIEVAKLCKKLHNDAIVVLGGLTATIFDKEILRKYEFVDMVVRGEAEKPFLALMQSLERHEKLENVPNLTYRDEDNNITSTPLMEPVVDLDEFEFTRLDLLTPNSTIFTPRMPPRWVIPVCRGCVHNCVACGGSAYSYKTYLGRSKPAFRSPEKIAEDIQILSDQGVHAVFLSQDPRMGGDKYWRKLIEILRKTKTQGLQLSMELFSPADEGYIKELLTIGVPLSLSISPESGVDSVRQSHGRNYTSDELFKTVKLCKSHGITMGIHSTIALANDTAGTIKETWAFWEQICSINQDVKGKSSVGHAFGPMILLDPGSLAFDFPESYGYRLRFNNLEEYVKGMSLPSWHQWISYETKLLDKKLIAKLIIDSIEHSIGLREKYGLYSQPEAEMERICQVDVNRLVIEVVNEAMDFHDEEKKIERLKALRAFVNRNIPRLVRV